MPEFVGRLRTPRLTSAPASPATGEMYYDTGQNKLFWWNGTAWLPASGADVVYNGAHPTGTPYTPGDVVVSNGVAYMAVKPTAAVPTPWPQVPPYPDTTGQTGKILTATSSGSPPTWQTPAPQGADLVYNGDYPANTPYTDGDIVISGGVAYMCVTPTSSAPTPWPGGPTIAPNPIPSYATTLPSSPIDGQEAVLVDSLTAPTYQWRFRYNAGSSSAYKWECIGGAPVYTEVTATEGTSSTSYVDLATAGPQLTAPRAGDYLIDYGFIGYNTAGPAYAICALKLAAAVAADTENLGISSSVANYQIPAFRRIRRTLAAGDAVRMQYKMYQGSVAYFYYRSLALLPVRIA